MFLTNNNPAFRNLSQTTIMTLTRFGGRYMPAGAEVLFARAIADRINYNTLIKVKDNISQYLIANKYNILSVVDFLSPYLKIENEERFRRFIEGFMKWRISVIEPKSSIIFSKGCDYAVDEMSKLPTYIDSVELCAVSDIYDDATFYSDFFTKLLSEIDFTMTEVS